MDLLSLHLIAGPESVGLLNLMTVVGLVDVVEDQEIKVN